MSLITDVLDRLSGIAVVKEQMGQTNQRMEFLTMWVLDHEKRLSRMEGGKPATAAKLKRPRR